MNVNKCHSSHLSARWNQRNVGSGSPGGASVLSSISFDDPRTNKPKYLHAQCAKPLSLCICRPQLMVNTLMRLLLLT